MPHAKTRPTTASVTDYLSAIEDDERRRACKQLSALMKRITGHTPKLWGPGIVGFGSYHYRYASGHEGDACLTGFAARKQELVVYLMAAGQEQPALLAKLGKYKLGKACLSLRRLSDVDIVVLEQLIAGSVAEVRRRYI